MAATAAYAGLRQGELFALTATQITADARVITVDRKIVEVAGKLYLEAPKGRKRRSAIYPVRTPDGYPLADKIVARTRQARGGPGFDALRMNEFTDRYAKLVFADPGLGLTPPYDLAALRESLPPGRLPVTRTYSLRRGDAERRQLAIDFVMHGDEGIAAPWAARAEPGDILTLSGAGGAYRPDPGRDWHLLAGDESALPAICSALEALPGDARGVAYLETCDPGEYLDATPPSGMEVVWLRRPQPGSQPRLLADALQAGPRLPGRAGVFAHRGAGVNEGGPRGPQDPAARR